MGEQTQKLDDEDTGAIDFLLRTGLGAVGLYKSATRAEQAAAEAKSSDDEDYDDDDDLSDLSSVGSDLDDVDDDKDLALKTQEKHGPLSPHSSIRPAAKATDDKIAVGSNAVIPF